MTTVDRKALPAQRVLSVRQTIRIDDLIPAQGESLSLLHRHAHEHDVEPAGPPFVRYHTFGDGETDVEVGFPVNDDVTGTGRVTDGELPAGAAATTWHLGGHDTLAEAYGRIESWLAEHDAEPDGGAWEIYSWIDVTEAPDPATWPDPASWRTEIVQPIR